MFAILFLTVLAATYSNLNTTAYADTFQCQTNSTSLSPMIYDPKNMELLFNVTGPTGTTGYINITVDKSFLPNAQTVKTYLDENPIEHQTTSNPTTWLISFTYPQSTHQIKIVFPPQENPTNYTPAGVALGISLAAAVLAIITFAQKKKANHKKSSPDTACVSWHTNLFGAYLVPIRNSMQKR